MRRQTVADIHVPFSRPAIGIEEERAVLEVLKSGWLTTGKYALRFESDFSDMSTYKGKQPTTRYEMASALARALAVVELGSRKQGKDKYRKACGESGNGKSGS